MLAIPESLPPNRYNIQLLGNCIPEELMEKILELLERNNLFAAYSTCKYWYEFLKTRLKFDVIVTREIVYLNGKSQTIWKTVSRIDWKKETASREIQFLQRLELPTSYKSCTCITPDIILFKKCVDPRFAIDESFLDLAMIGPDNEEISYDECIHNFQSHQVRQLPFQWQPPGYKIFGDKILFLSSPSISQSNPSAQFRTLLIWSIGSKKVVFKDEFNSSELINITLCYNRFLIAIFYHQITYYDIVNNQSKIFPFQRQIDIFIEMIEVREIGNNWVEIFSNSRSLTQWDLLTHNFTMNESLFSCSSEDKECVITLTKKFNSSREPNQLIYDYQYNLKGENFTFQIVGTEEHMGLFCTNRYFLYFDNKRLYIYDLQTKRCPAECKIFSSRMEYPEILSWKHVLIEEELFIWLKIRDTENSWTIPLVFNLNTQSIEAKKANCYSTESQYLLFFDIEWERGATDSYHFLMNRDTLSAPYTVFTNCVSYFSISNFDQKQIFLGINNIPKNIFTLISWDLEKKEWSYLIKSDSGIITSIHYVYNEVVLTVSGTYRKEIIWSKQTTSEPESSVTFEWESYDISNICPQFSQIDGREEFLFIRSDQKLVRFDICDLENHVILSSNCENFMIDKENLIIFESDKTSIIKLIEFITP